MKIENLLPASNSFLSSARVVGFMISDIHESRKLTLFLSYTRI